MSSTSPNGHEPFRRLQILSLASVLLATSVQAATAQDMPGDALIEGLHDTVSETVQTLGESIDEFLSDREYENEQNDTEVRLRFDLDLSNDRDTAFQVDPKIRLRLPNTEQLFLLDFAGERSVEEEDGVTGGLLEEGRGTEEQLALRLRFLRPDGPLRIAPEAGLTYKNDTIGGFAGVRLSRFWELSDVSQIFASQRFRWLSDNGWRSLTKIRVDHKLDDRTLLRGELRADWRENRAGFTYRPGALLRRVLNDKSVLSWETYVTIESASSHQAIDAVTGVRYRRLIYGDWLFAEAIPWVGYERGSDFDTIYGARLRIDMFF